MKQVSIRSLNAHTTASEEAMCPKTRRGIAGTTTRYPDGMTPSRAANVTRPREVTAGSMKLQLPGTVIG